MGDRMTPFQWDNAMHPTSPWQVAYGEVEREARYTLENDPTLDTDMSTAALVERLYPEEWARGKGITARKRIFKALRALTTRGLADCCHRGAERRLRHSNKMVRPWLWHAPTSPNSEAQGNAKACPHCGGLLP